MGEIWGPVVGSLGFTALIILPFVINKIVKFKLEIAKINADTTIKAEEIRAKNQLEIEKLIRNENSLENNMTNTRFINDEYTERTNRGRLHE